MSEPIDLINGILADATRAVHNVQQACLYQFMEPIEGRRGASSAGKAFADKMHKASTAYLDAFNEAASQFKTDTQQCAISR